MKKRFFAFLCTVALVISTSLTVLADETQKPLLNINAESQIVFDDVPSFFDSDQNYRIIVENINSFRVEELKTSIKNYASTHQNDIVLLNAILDSLNKYGDFENLVCEIDSFSGETNIFYDGYAGIDTEHYIYPHFSNGKYLLRLGFVRDDWIFAEKIILKRVSESMESALQFNGDSFDFERDVLSNGMVLECKEESLYHTRIESYLDNLDEKMAIRFEAENGEALDYILTDMDKSALRNIAKYSKLMMNLSDIYDDNELYYTQIPESNKNADTPYQFNVKLISKSEMFKFPKYYVYFGFEINNMYGKTISDINGIGTFLDSHGKQIIQMRFNFTDLEIQTEDVLQEEMYYECESYEEIYNTPDVDLTFIYTPESIVFSDGTSEQF